MCRIYTIFFLFFCIRYLLRSFWPQLSELSDTTAAYTKDNTKNLPNQPTEIEWDTEKSIKLFDFRYIHEIFFRIVKVPVMFRCRACYVWFHNIRNYASVFQTIAPTHTHTNQKISHISIAKEWDICIKYAKDIICWLNAICSECEWFVCNIYFRMDSLLSNDFQTMCNFLHMIQSWEGIKQSQVSLYVGWFYIVCVLFIFFSSTFHSSAQVICQLIKKLCSFNWICHGLQLKNMHFNSGQICLEVFFSEQMFKLSIDVRVCI